MRIDLKELLTNDTRLNAAGWAYRMYPESKPNTARTVLIRELRRAAPLNPGTAALAATEARALATLIADTTRIPNGRPPRVQHGALLALLADTRLQKRPFAVAVFGGEYISTNAAESRLRAATASKELTEADARRLRNELNQLADVLRSAAA